MEECVVGRGHRHAKTSHNEIHIFRLNNSSFTGIIAVVSTEHMVYHTTKTKGL